MLCNWFAVHHCLPVVSNRDVVHHCLAGCQQLLSNQDMVYHGILRRRNVMNKLSEKVQRSLAPSNTQQIIQCTKTRDISYCLTDHSLYVYSLVPSNTQQIIQCTKTRDILYCLADHSLYVVL